MDFVARLKKFEKPFIALSIALIFVSLYVVFMVVPNERIMGPVQRIFYFHVGSAIACYCAFGMVFLSGLGYLATRKDWMDVVSVAAAEVGLVFCSITLFSGMIWGHSAWNTWFRFEPRLVTFLLLWLIFLAFNLLRMFGDVKKVAVHSAVLGILGGLNIPLVVISIKFLPQAAQLHPEVVANRGLKSPLFIFAMFLSMGALVLLQFLLVWIRARIEFLNRKISL